MNKCIILPFFLLFFVFSFAQQDYFIRLEAVQWFITLNYNYLQKSFNNQRKLFGGFLKDVFFKTVTAKDVDRVLADTK